MSDSQLIVRFDDEPEPPLEIIEIAHAHGFPDQAGDTVAPLVVHSFNDTGFAAAFVARPMLPGGEPFGIGLVEVAIDQLAPVRSRQTKPQADEALGAAVANEEADDLSCQPRDRKPQVAIAPLEAKADHQLIDFQSIAFDRRQDCVWETQARGL